MRRGGRRRGQTRHVDHLSQGTRTTTSRRARTDGETGSEAPSATRWTRKTDPQVQHLGIATKVYGGNRTTTYVGQPIVLSRTPAKIVTHPPELGEHTDEILREVDYDQAAIDHLRTRQVV